VFDKTVSATFSESMNSASHTATSFTLHEGANLIDGLVSYSGTSALFIPTADLSDNTLYTATITTGAESITGNNLKANYVLTFSTMSAAPLIILTDPLQLAIDVALDKTVTATFSEPMNGTTITASSFTISEGSNPVAGVVSYFGTAASFNPDSDFPEGTVFTARISTDVISASGTVCTATFLLMPRELKKLLLHGR